MAKLVKIANSLEEIVDVADKREIFTKSDFEAVAKEVAPNLEFTGDDWIKGFYPSETASIALTERNSDGNIIRTGIAALYDGFPIVVADDTGCCLYKDGKIIPVVSVNRIFTGDSKIPTRCHIFGQKPTPHWVWMNKIIGFLNEANIRTDNNMGPYFLLRNFFYYNCVVEKGIEISPEKGVISEPFSNKPKEEIGAFIIRSLNQGLLVKEQFTLTNMSGKKLFHNDRIERVESCEIPYCAAGWIAGPSNKLVFEVLSEMKSAVEALGEPEDANEKIKQLIGDLDHFKPQL